MMVCMTTLGPSAGVLVVVLGMDVGLVPIIKPKNGSGFALAMGLDGAVCKSGSNWYDSESESKVVWPFDGVEGHQEWSRRCRFNDPYCGGSPLRCEEEHERSIMSDLYVKMVKYGDDFWTPVLMDSYWLQVVTRPPRLPEDSAWLFPHRSASQSMGVVAHFA